MSMSSPKCPTCDRFLRNKRILDIEVKLCPSGDGSWLNPNTMTALSTEDVRGTPLDVKTGITLSSRQRPSKRPCPVCEKLMLQYQWNYGSHIYLDTCSNCHGVWMDRGELVMMQRYLKQMDNHIKLNPVLAAKVNAARKGPADRTPLEKVYNILDKTLWALITFLP